MAECRLLCGTSAIIDQWLGADENWRGKSPKFRHKRNLVSVLDRFQNGLPPLPAACLLQRIEANWDAAQQRAPRQPSPKNWRFCKKTVVASHNKRPEKSLEKRIASATDESWANQIPTASGLVDCHGRHCNVDLSKRWHEIDFELIELKCDWGAGNPISAAFQALCYGLVYLFWRIKRFRYDPIQQPVLGATQIRLRVLAPEDYYMCDNPNATFQYLERSVSSAVTALARDRMGADLSMDFSYDAFPQSFRHDCADEALICALDGRAPLYPR